MRRLHLPDELVDNYRRFRSNRYPQERERYRRLARDGQRPEVLVVACLDSRSGPETVFDAAPGELAVVRNVGALVPVYAPDMRSHAASAAIEFAVLALDVRSIVVMGHGRCGAIAAAFDDAVPLTRTDFLGTWVAPLKDLAIDLDPEVWASPELRWTALERRSIEQSVVNLRTFPWVRAREDAGALQLAGCWFDIGLGELHQIDRGTWVRVDDA